MSEGTGAAVPGRQEWDRGTGERVEGAAPRAPRSERGTEPPPQQPPARSDVIAILATMGDRSPDEVAEEIGSLELAWLVSQVEDRYHTTLELDDAALARMMTVSGAVATIHRLLEGGTHG